MLIHITPRIETEGLQVILDRIEIPEFGLVLKRGVDVQEGRPWHNKCWTIAGRNNAAGMFIEAGREVAGFNCKTIWQIGDLRLIHHVAYSILDSDFDAVTDRRIYWYAQRGYPNRMPTAGTFSQPKMSYCPRVKAVKEQLVDGKRVVESYQTFAMPTIERERLLERNVEPWVYPALEDAVVAKRPILKPTAIKRCSNVA